MKKHNKNDLMAILQVFGTLWQVDCQRLFQNGTFQRVVWRGFSQSVISSGIHQLWPSSFFSKCLKFDVNSRNGTENWEKLIQFQDNWIWFWSAKFSQSSTGYLRLAVYVLTNTFFKSTCLRMIKDMIKALSWRFRKYLGRFHKFTLKAFSETALFRECSNQLFHNL